MILIMTSKGVECAFCQSVISDRFVLWVDGQSWHGSCLRCNVCRCELQEKCYRVQNTLYCKKHYYKCFGINCAVCDDTIKPGIAVQFINGIPVHELCFRCHQCDRIVLKGDQYFMNSGKLYCLDELDRIDETLEEQEEQKFETFKDSHKRPRTILSSYQRRKFLDVFRINPKPSRKLRDQLAEETGLKARVVQVWFQNERAKKKKLSIKSASNRYTRESISDDESQLST